MPWIFFFRNFGAGASTAVMPGAGVPAAQGPIVAESPGGDCTRVLLNFA